MNKIIITAAICHISMACTKESALIPVTGILRVKNTFSDPIIRITTIDSLFVVNIPKDSTGAITLEEKDQEIKITLSSYETHSYSITVKDFGDSVIIAK